MTHAAKPAPLRAALPAAALAALLLAGCSTGHIGESWQCPLAEGGLCDSVAAADPAVPDRQAGEMTVLAEPLWRVRDTGPETPAEPSPARGPGQACAAECDGGFDPFAWLAGLFAAAADGGDARPAGRSAEAPAAPAAQPSDPASGEAADAAVAPAGTEPEAEDPAAALLPAPGSRPGQAPGPAQDDPDAGDLRTDEAVARIWIAPFVDGSGVYREASYVRVVLEPAGWRLK